MEEKIEEFAHMLKKAKYCCALTGAGISTESGIPDFRSPGIGLWTSVDPIINFSVETFVEKPEVFFAILLPFVEKIRSAKPNQAHYTLAELERLGLIKTIITQNIDELHQKAGSKKVLEIHGHLRSGRCIKCGTQFKIEAILEKLTNTNAPPKCNQCNMLIKPDVTLFGDSLPIEFERAIDELEKCDLLIIIGSSLTVAPASYLPNMVKKFAIINHSQTPYDGKAEAVLYGSASQLLGKVLYFLKE
jgi:NAD-dependent deacetylase